MVWEHFRDTDRYFVSDLFYEVEFTLRRPWHHPFAPVHPLALPPEEALERLRKACREDITVHPVLWSCTDLWEYVIPDLWGDFFMDALEREIGAGNVAILRLEKEWWPAPQPWPGTETGTGAGTETGPRPVTDTWFELRVIDEMGVPIPGVELYFAFDRQTRVTDGDGRIRIDGVSARFHQTQVRTPPAAARPEPGALDSLRAAVKPRWDEARPGPRYEPQGDDLVVPLHGEVPIDMSLLSERTRTIVVVPWVVRARFEGFYFSYGRCFLRPEGLADIRTMVDRWRPHGRSAGVVVGHTSIDDDVPRATNLSLQRAHALLTYLRGDVDWWLGHYTADVPRDERWGLREDQLMLCALADSDELQAQGDTIASFQASRGLEASGTMNRLTRETLLREYMGLLAPNNSHITTARAYGWGPWLCNTSDLVPPPGSAGVGFGRLPPGSSPDAVTDEDPTGDSRLPRGDQLGASRLVCEPAPEDVDGNACGPSRDVWHPPHLPPDTRQLELYLFDVALGPQPDPANEMPGPDISSHQEWERRARERHECQQSGDEMPCHFSFVFLDEHGRPVAATPFALDLGAAVVLRGTTDSSGCFEWGDVPSGDYQLRVGRIRMLVPALNKSEHRRPLRLRQDGVGAR